MLHSLENPNFFKGSEIERLKALGLWQEAHTPPSKLAFAGLMLAPIMQIVVRDNATSTAEFEAVENYLSEIEQTFALATAADMESIGTDMGLLPMLPASWDVPQFIAARTLLAEILTHLTIDEANAVRNLIARGALSAAKAGSPHMFSVHMVDQGERNIIHDLIRDLSLEKSAEGLNLINKSS